MSGSTQTGPVLRTLVFTDLVGSTRLVEEIGDRRAAQISEFHDRAARDLLEAHGGLEIDKSDGFLLLFERPLGAVRFALAYHQALSELSRELGVQLRSRAGAHLGEVFLRESPPDDVARGAKALEVEGLAKPTGFRVMSVAMGGQTLLTRGLFDLARRAAVGEELAAGPVSWLAHGPYRFKGVEEPVELFEVGVVGQAPLTPPPDGEKVHRAVAAGDEATLGWRPAPGQEVPRRPSWVLVEKLGEGGFGEVWLAEHKGLGERRVFKFCFEAQRLSGLRREVSLLRLLRDALGHRPDIARVLDWDFDGAPYFLETDYTESGSLPAWMEAAGGAGAVPPALRIELMAQVAEALGAAHSVGVLHKDVKPSNVLVSTGPDGSPHAVLTDFGVGLVLDRSLLVERGITVAGLTEITTGTQMYLAPELLEGRVATVQADVYALGVTLYQAVVGDFGRALAPGWERDVEDEVLREDIALLVDGRPERRPASAEVADRLRSLEARRARRAAEAEARTAAERAARLRRVATVGAAVTGAVAVVVSVFAVQTARARELADVRRDQAEGLIDFMLGDLRSKLEPLGRLELLDDVGHQAMAYFAAIPLGEFSDAELASRSQALHQIGQVRIRQGRLDEAEPAIRESLRLARELSARHPEDGDRLFGLGQSEFWIADLLRRRGDLEGTLAHVRAYLGVSTRLVALDPERPEWQAELGYARANLGAILELQGDLEGSVEALTQALSVRETLHAREPDEPRRIRDLAAARSRLATSLNRLGEVDRALEQHREALSLRRSLVERDPVNMLWQRELAISHNYVGDILEETGNPLAALEEFRAQLALDRVRSAVDPANVVWRRDLAVSEGRVGQVLGALGDPTAEGHFRAALALLRELTDDDPGSVPRRRDLAEKRLDFAGFLLEEDDAAGAGELADSARELLLPILEAEPEDVEARLLLGRLHILDGRVHDARGDSAAASAAWTRSADILGPLAAGSNDRSLLDPWARALLRLGRTEEARAVVERLLATGYREGSFLELWTASGGRAQP